jgi:hypothetical protein
MLGRHSPRPSQSAILHRVGTQFTKQSGKLPRVCGLEVELLARRSMEHHLERRLRSITIF